MRDERGEAAKKERNDRARDTSAEAARDAFLPFQIGRFPFLKWL